MLPERISGYSVQRAAQKIDKAIEELAHMVGEMKSLFRKSEELESEEAQRDLKVLSTIADALLMGAEVNARAKVRTYLETIPFEHVKSEGKETVGYSGVPPLLKVCQVLDVEKEELNARKKDMTYCEVCKKAVKNLKSHSKAQSHVGRVRIKELQHSGWVQTRATSHSQEWTRFIDELRKPDVPNVERMRGYTSYNTGTSDEVDTTLYDFKTPEAMKSAWIEQTKDYGSKYDYLIVTQPYSYNRNGSANRYGGSLWVKESLASYGEILQKSTKRMGSRGFRDTRTPEVRKKQYVDRKNWRASMDKLLFDPSKLKIWSTMQALKG